MLGVRPAGQEAQPKAIDSSLDSAIEDNFEASLKAHKNLDDQHISCDAQNGTLVLKGSVKTSAERDEAQKTAKAAPNVKQVAPRCPLVHRYLLARPTVGGWRDLRQHHDRRRGDVPAPHWR